MECGFGNGYLNPKQKKLPYERAVTIANYLNIPVEDIFGGEENEKTPTISGERKISDDDLKFALWGSCEDVDDDDLDDVRRYAAFVRERKNKK